MRFCGRPWFAFVLKNGYNHEVAGRAVGSLVFANGSGATTGNKMMGVSPIFFLPRKFVNQCVQRWCRTRAGGIRKRKATARYYVQNDMQ
ncbi:hypothetical protein BTO02_13365 [Paraburkholderia sp. SOS3]|nr:hypothetical protein BTO02_13365 [Paraburkholderia sp. SOS3]